MSALAQGNAAVRAGEYDAARRHYADALITQPGLVETVLGNLQRLARLETANSSAADTLPSRVIVAGCELGHNAAGRAAMLTELYARAGIRTELVGLIVAPYIDIWGPLRESNWPRRTAQINSFGEFLPAMIPLVAAERADVVHLSKARGPNLLTAALYKIFWNSTVIIDVDDEELGFVGADGPLSFEQWQTLPSDQRALRELFGKHWTQLAVGLIGAFDGVTVANKALQSRYGGLVVPHARDESWLIPEGRRRIEQRARWGIDADARVVLFFGTPRAHKGLIEVARALASLNDSRWQLVIVGAFEDGALQRELESIGAGLIRCLPSQPMSAIPDVLSMADVCILLQQGRGQAAQLQTPAKLTDALAMQVPVLATRTEGLREFIDRKAVFPTSQQSLPQDLVALWDRPDSVTRRTELITHGRQVFDEHLSYAVNAERLRAATQNARARALTGDSLLRWAPVQILRDTLLASSSVG
jgi:glycosyltransferase involved in cell wall biosynthesis